MKRVLTAVVLAPLALLAIFKAPLWLLGLLVLALALLATGEYLEIAKATGTIPFEQLTYLVMIVLFLSTAGRAVISEQWMRLAQNSAGSITMASHPYLVHAGKTLIVFWLFLLSSPAWFLLRGLVRQDLRSSLPGAGVSLFSVFYIGLPFLAIFELRADGEAPLLLYAFLVVWAGDIAAYYFGGAFGKHKLAPKISPGKTWEGAVASLLASAALGAAIFAQAPQFLRGLAALHLVEPPSVLARPASAWWLGLACAIGLNIAAQLGDLVESMFKRGANLKDSGSLLPGHGGVLDRVDALLFAVPLLWFYSILHMLNL